MRKIGLAFALCTLAPLASAQVHSLGPVSFAVPEGMTYQEEGDHAAMGRMDGQSFVIAISAPVASVGDPDATFRSNWARIAQTPPPSPYGIHPKGGYGGRYGSTGCKDKMNCILFTLETGQGVVPIFVLIPNQQPDWNFFWPFHQGVRMSPAKAQPVKKDINLGDLVGRWSWGASSAMAYVSPSSGMVFGTSVNAANSTYTFAADGTYTVSSSGINGSRTFHEETSGRVELTREVIIFHEKNRGDKRYRFIGYVNGVDGTTIMTLLNASYDTTPPNIQLYAEDFVRPPG